MTYELKIGFCDQFNQEMLTVVHHEYFSANSLNVAKSLATRKMKSLQPMQKYLQGWSVWGQARERDVGCWYTNKKSAPIRDDTIGFCQLSWDDLQMSLFEDVPTPA